MNLSYGLKQPFALRFPYLGTREMHQKVFRGSSIPIRFSPDTRSLQLRHILGRQLPPPKYTGTQTHWHSLCLCELCRRSCRGELAAEELVPLHVDLPVMVRGSAEGWTVHPALSLAR